MICIYCLKLSLLLIKLSVSEASCYAFQQSLGVMFQHQIFVYFFFFPLFFFESLKVLLLMSERCVIRSQAFPFIFNILLFVFLNNFY